MKSPHLEYNYAIAVNHAKGDFEPTQDNSITWNTCLEWLWLKDSGGAVVWTNVVPVASTLNFRKYRPNRFTRIFIGHHSRAIKTFNPEFTYPVLFENTFQLKSIFQVYLTI